MNKFRRVWRWFCHILDKCSTYKIDGQISGRAFFYHSGSIVNMQVIINQYRLDEQDHSITTSSTTPNIAQLSRPKKSG